jgi:hypothetical protein
MKRRERWWDDKSSEIPCLIFHECVSYRQRMLTSLLTLKTTCRPDRWLANMRKMHDDPLIKRADELHCLLLQHRQ